MGSFDMANTDETLRNVFVKNKTLAATDDSDKFKEGLATELLKGLSPEQIMAVISAINKKRFISGRNMIGLSTFRHIIIQEYFVE